MLLKRAALILIVLPILILLSRSAPSVLHTVAKAANPPADTIFIQPFYPVTDSFATLSANELKAFYADPVVILPKRDIYTKARSATGRYSADILLTCLSAEHRSKGYKILGLASYDIFTASHGVKEWGIFGLGNCPGNACIVSDFRLKKFTGKTQEFTINVVLHEIGHNFGLPHCDKDEKCLMNDAKGTIATLYKEQKWLCPSCVDKLKKIRESKQKALI